MTQTVLRWGLRLVGTPLRNHLVIEWALWAFLIVQADVILDWGALHRGLVAQPGWVAGAALAVGVGLQWWSGRRLVRGLLLGPGLEILRRQPVPDWGFGVGAGCFLGLVSAPVGVVAVGWYWRLDAAVLWVALAALPVLLAGAGRWGLGAAALVLAGAVAAVAHSAPGLFTPLACLAVVAQLQLLGRCMLRLAREGDRRRLWVPWPAPGAAWALVGRDVRALARAEQGVLLAVGAVAGVLGLVVFAVRVNNALAGLPLVRAALVGIAVGAPLALLGVGAASRRLGEQFDPAHWPVPARGRAAALATTAGLLLAPSWAAAAVGGAGGLGVVEHVRLALLVGALAAGVAWFVAVRPRKPDLAIYPWWAALCLGFAVLGSVWGPVAVAGLGVSALWLAEHRLALRRRRR